MTENLIYVINNAANGDTPQLSEPITADNKSLGELAEMIKSAANMTNVSDALPKTIHFCIVQKN